MPVERGRRVKSRQIFHILFLIFHLLLADSTSWQEASTNSYEVSTTSR